jgi:hypothetical protein
MDNRTSAACDWKRTGNTVTVMFGQKMSQDTPSPPAQKKNKAKHNAQKSVIKSPVFSIIFSTFWGRMVPLPS